MSKKPRASLPCGVAVHTPQGFYGRAEIESAPRSCCGLREKTADPFKILLRAKNGLDPLPHRSYAERTFR